MSIILEQFSEWIKKIHKLTFCSMVVYKLIQAPSVPEE